MLYDLNNKIYKKEKANILLCFLYNTIIGRIILKLFYNKLVANIYSKYMTSKISKYKIKKFIKKNNINMDDYIKKEYLSFNDFFIRKLKPNKRKIENGLIAPCDSKVSAYRINSDSKFKIKNSIYTLEELIKEKNTKYKWIIIFRLSVDDYHHYIFPDSGKVISSKYIEGKLHTVQPIAQRKYKVFKENSRCITHLKCDKLGNVCFIEVGALMVGKIVNENIKTFKKGDEKGHFEFGGSTVILLFEDNIKINKTILNNTKKEIETIVKLGNKIGDIYEK